jgi:hypothetical protein
LSRPEHQLEELPNRAEGMEILPCKGTHLTR